MKKRDKIIGRNAHQTVNSSIGSRLRNAFHKSCLVIVVRNRLSEPLRFSQPLSDTDSTRSSGHDRALANVILSLITCFALGLTVIGCGASQPVKESKAADPAEDRQKAEQEYSIAYEYMKQANYGAAIDHLNEAVKVCPSFYAAYIALGQSYRARGDAAMAETVYAKAKVIDPKDTRAFEGLAALHIEQKRYPDAVSEYESALLLDSTKVTILNGLAFVYARTEEYDRSLTLYRRSLELEPETYSTYYAIARVYIDKGESDSAVAYLEKLKQKKPDLLEVRQELAKVYQEIKKYDKAVEEYLYLLSVKPDDQFNHVQLGFLYSKQKKYNAAQKEYEEAARLVPGDPLPKLYIADLFITRGKYAAAEEAVREVLAIAPENLYAQVLLGDIYEKKGIDAKSAWDKNKSKANIRTAKSGRSLLNQAITCYNRAAADAQFEAYVSSEINRCSNWLKQLDEDIWFYEGGTP